MRIKCGQLLGNRIPSPQKCRIVPSRLVKTSESFLIDGEAVIVRDDGTPDFHALRSQRRGHEAVLCRLRPDRA